VANERRATDQFIYSKLRADTALVALIGGEPSPRLWSDAVIPQGAVMPFVSFGPLSFLDRNALPATVTIFSMPVYWVRGVVQGRDLTVGYQIQNRIDVALRGQFGNVVIGSETYYVGPWFRRAVRQLPPENEGTMVYTTIGVEVESRVQRIA
jgi:hypothetical protein